MNLERPQPVRMKQHQQEVEELRFAVVDSMALSGEIYGALWAALRQLNAPPKERNEMEIKHRTLQSTLKRILGLINLDMRGLNNAKAETVEMKVEELLALLPPDRRQKLLERMLEKEGQQNNATPL